MRKIVATLLLTIVILSVFVQQVQAVTIKFTSKGKWWEFWKWDVHIEITVEQLLEYLPKFFKLFVGTPSTDAFREVEMMLAGWIYETDGETYILLSAPAPIDEVGQYYVCDFVSVYDDYHEFYWEAYDVDGILVDFGDVLFKGPGGGVWVPVDKLGLLAPYISLASTIAVATVATAIYVKRVKRRKEKQ